MISMLLAKSRNQTLNFASFMDVRNHLGIRIVLLSQGRLDKAESQWW